MNTDRHAETAADVVAEVAAEFADLAQVLSDGQDTDQMLRRVIQLAARTVAGSEHAGISVINGDGLPHTIVSTDALPEQVDRLQYRFDEGPGLQALVLSDIALANDLTTDEQWPTFAHHALRETGVHSMLSFRLYLTAEDRGSLNFYATRPRAFPLSSMATGSIFAAYTSLALLAALNREKAITLQGAAESNRELGTAIGILMANHNLTQREAFNLLHLASRTLHRKMQDIAADINLTGEPPELPPKRRNQPSLSKLADWDLLGIADWDSTGHYSRF